MDSAAHADLTSILPAIFNSSNPSVAPLYTWGRHLILLLHVTHWIQGEQPPPTPEQRHPPLGQSPTSQPSLAGFLGASTPNFPLSSLASSSQKTARMVQRESQPSPSLQIPWLPSTQEWDPCLGPHLPPPHHSFTKSQAQAALSLCSIYLQLWCPSLVWDALLILNPTPLVSCLRNCSQVTSIYLPALAERPPPGSIQLICQF